MVVVLAVLLVAASCGNLETSVSAPLPTQPSPSVPVFDPGSYFLGFSAGAPGNLCLCIGRCPSTIRVPVIVDGADDGFTVRAVYGDLRVTLSLNGAAAGGSMRGAATDGAPSSPTRLWIEEGEASLTGRVLGARAMSGSVAGGRVSIGDAHGSGGCSSANWSLSER